LSLLREVNRSGRGGVGALERIRTAVQDEEGRQQAEPQQRRNNGYQGGYQKHGQHDPRPVPLPSLRSRIDAVRQVRKTFPHQHHVRALHQKKHQGVERQRE
jgi:hypothetical protein